MNSPAEISSLSFKFCSALDKKSIPRALWVVFSLSLVLRVFVIIFNKLLVEEAYYWNYAQHLDFGYLDHPPMVALWIKLSTTLFGIHEWSVRITTIVGWFSTAFFSYKLTNLIRRDTGQYAVFLLAVLPFFFLESLAITPDQPLLVCWSAALYSLYRSLVLNEKNYWYAVGACLGLGMLSKYTIVLLGPVTLIYLMLVPSARFWFRRKEPYLAVLIAALLFSPVIYWNATHNWISFLFQSSQRVEASSYPHLHQFLGLLFIFLTPIGVWGLAKLWQRNTLDSPLLEIKTKRFLQCFTFLPLIFFAVFSLNHNIKFNWIGSCLLALIPWFAQLIAHSQKHYKYWIQTSVALVIIYSVLIFGISLNNSEWIQQKLIKNLIAWDEVAQHFNELAQQVEMETGKAPFFVPLDKYPIASELAFYQAKLLAEGKITKAYPIMGCHILGGESLMYRYWSTKESLLGSPLILISSKPQLFENADLNYLIIDKSLVKTSWSYSQGKGIRSKPYYYKLVEKKEA